MYGFYTAGSKRLEVIYDKRLDLKIKKSRREIKKYCRKIIERVPFNGEAKKVAYKKYNENNKYLDDILVTAIKNFANQVYLFYN